MSCSALKKKDGWSSKVIIAQRLAGHRSAQGGWWGIAFASLGFFSFLHSLNCLHLDLWIFSLLLLLCFPCPTGGWVDPDLLTGSTHCKHAGKLATLRETGSPNQHGVRLDYGLTCHISAFWLWLLFSWRLLLRWFFAEILERVVESNCKSD